MTDDRVPRWQTMADAEREQQYSPSSMLDGPLDPYLDDYARRSAESYAALDDTVGIGNVVTVRYGDRPSNTVDIAVPAISDQSSSRSELPLHVFIHGGYWQQLSKRESFFAASAFVGRGCAFAAVDYTLAPEATLDQIVSECEAAITELHTLGARAELPISPDRITISGSSAGAHLAALVTARNPGSHGPAALVLLSGVYDLEPLVGTTINDAVGLDTDTARALSPLRHDLSGFPPTLVAWGDNETDEFKRQSRSLVDGLRAAGRPVAEIEVADRNHFDIVHDLPTLVDQIPTGPETHA